MKEETNPLGNVYISHRAIATIAYQSALESYGVVGLAAKNFTEGLTQAIVKDPALGVKIEFDGDAITIEMFIIVEYGTHVKSVASSVAHSVRYQIEKALGLPVNEINVHVRGLRISNTD
ncbi:MAG: Asp23/Gls24 family envelope stress response protein [Anaerolineaceae bacterium]|nr:Asp23/Gls24 family envelope stress response protein [Anaerolineaceae bacterium]